jgi:hypothetical protein
MRRESDGFIREKIKEQGSRWVAEQRFWLFGTATYFDGADIDIDEATADAKHFFNVLDRQLISKANLKQGCRLPRLVFIEQGRSRSNTHIHFFIKGNKWQDYRQIFKQAPTCWKEKIQKSHNLIIKDNLGTKQFRSAYCWKEYDSLYAYSLLVDCCHLNSVG